MGRTVADIAALLSVLAAVDEADPAGPAARGKIARDYAVFLDVDALRGRRIGLLRQAMGYHPDVDAATERAAAAIKAAGGEVIDVKIATYDKWNGRLFLLPPASLPMTTYCTSYRFRHSQKRTNSLKGGLADAVTQTRRDR